mmetsp:Transcript_949/g.2359  ORF Transcript_949/g.2359 Transcript_949/m.2359 type:complete len:430 (+) Transcript_949:208-1497(+)
MAMTASPKVSDMAQEASTHGGKRGGGDPAVLDIMDKLRGAAAAFDESWKGTFMAFGSLVDRLDGMAAALSADELDSAKTKQTEFFQALDQELIKVSQVFHDTANQLRKAEENGRLWGKKRGRVVPRIMYSMDVGRGVKVSTSKEHSYIHSVYCVVYAQLHREALRVLLAHHDTVSSTSLGDMYMSEVWQASDSRGLFLHSALLREVDAVLHLMTRKLQIIEGQNTLVPPQIEALHRTGMDYSQGEAALIEGASMVAEEAASPKAAVSQPQLHPADTDAVPEHLKALITCPICLEYMYRPHGLECGHGMCTPCLLVTNGMERGIAPSLRAMMSHLPYQKAGRCPVCRQGIAAPPTELTALGRVVKKYAPEHFKACDKAFLGQQTQLRGAFEDQIMKELEVDSNPLFPVLDRIPRMFSRSKEAGRSRTARE